MSVGDAVREEVARVDALVAALNVDFGDQPDVTPRDVVLVVGPWLAGTTSLVAALRRAMPGREFVEVNDITPQDAPLAVVFAASAAAPLVDSDCALVDAAAAHTDLVIGVVTKIDVHIRWRDKLVADRSALAAHHRRYTTMTWVGAAAAPEVGEPDIDDLVVTLRRLLSDPGVPRRNRLRSWHTRIEGAIRRSRDEVAGVSREARMIALRDQRREVVRQSRTSRSEHSLALRSHLQQARMQLTYYARSRCTSVRTELAEDVGTATRRGLRAVEKSLPAQADEIVDDVNLVVTNHLTDMARTLGLTPPAAEPPPPSPPVPAPPLTSRRLENRLILVLGVGFGLGVALAMSRLVADLAPAYTAAGLVVGAAVGLAAALWIVSIRGLLHERAVVDRWVTDSTTVVRMVAEQLVATRVLHAETVLTAEDAELDATRAAAFADQLTNIDAELQEYALDGARAAAHSHRALPILRRARDAIRAELSGPPGRALTGPMKSLPSGASNTGPEESVRPADAERDN